MSAHDRRRWKRRHNHISERTKMRRPAHCLSPENIRVAKGMRDEGKSFEEVAEAMGFPLRDVELALANSRSPNPQNPQACIHTNRTTLARFRRKELPGETRHQTLMRLLNEHEHFERLFRG